MGEPKFYSIVLHVIINVDDSFRGELLESYLVNCEWLKNIGNQDLHLLDWRPALFEFVNFSHFYFIDSDLGVDLNSWLYDFLSLFIIFVNLDKAIESNSEIILVIKILKAFQVHDTAIILFKSLYLIQSLNAIIINEWIEV